MKQVMIRNTCVEVTEEFFEHLKENNMIDEDPNYGEWYVIGGEDATFTFEELCGFLQVGE